MPIYEYACNHCQLEFEVLVRGSQLPTCPQCQSDQLMKLFSVPAAHSSNNQSQAAPRPGEVGCGLPQCGGGRCAGR
ncbi:MAG TPA: zinc ribbon domain-containing protein [Planctomycetes bacterium]|nr:zinc ribbon domain-containing protein [Planctomycetota bacterium]